MLFGGHSVRFADGAHCFAGISDGNRVGGYVFGHYAACADDGSVAYVHTGQQGDVGGNPYVVADGDGFCLHDSGVALVGMVGVDDGAKATVGADEHVVADADFGFVEDGEVVIPHEVLSDADVGAEIAVERAVQDEPFANLAEQLFFDGAPFLCGGGGE